MKVLVSTVWHSGSEYLRKQLLSKGHNVSFCHCDQWIWSLLNGTEFDEIHTTFRNVFHVGASWGNKYDLTDSFIEKQWFSQWSNWLNLIDQHKAEIHSVKQFDGPPVNEKPDTNNLHEALKEGNMSHYYSIVPEAWIDHANMCVLALANVDTYHTA
jgi:hypothetical protein